VCVTDKIIRTSCALHNWLRKASPTAYFQRECVDYEDMHIGELIEGSWRNENLHLLPSMDKTGSNHSPRMARELRKRYTMYFVKDGVVSWQSRMIH
jgi:hypothetical protein